MKVDLLSDFLMLKKVMGNRLLGTNGAISALKSQAKVMSNYANVTINGRGNDFDIYHSHSSMPFTYKIVQNALKDHKPVIMTAHQTHRDTDESLFLPNFTNEIIKWYIAWYLSLADLIICPTEIVKEIVRKELNIRERPIKVVSNGINTRKFVFSSEKRTHFRKKYDLHKPTVISVGMPINRKGFDNFLRIAWNVKECDFLWIGEHLFPFLNSRTKQNNNNVITPGYVEDINAVYSGADIFCFPSFYEGEGLVILEAMSCGLPVVIRDLPVYEKRYIDGETCLKARNDKEFIDCIYYLYNNPEERERIAKNGQKLVRRSFDVRRSVEKLYNLYEKVIKIKS